MKHFDLARKGCAMRYSVIEDIQATIEVYNFTEVNCRVLYVVIICVK